MKIKPYSVLLFLAFCFLFSQLSIGFSAYAQYPENPVIIRLEVTKMPPVVFPHTPHVEKNKIECVVCHHKGLKEPKACTKCHKEKEEKGKAPIAKDVFHNKCLPCHRMNLEKEIKSPTKCSECHKR